MVSVVVPIYYCDTALYSPIQRCLDSLSGRDVELVTVDDSSPLDIPPHWPITCHNIKNLGFTATVNKGLSIATGDILVVMNDDIEMDQKCLDRYSTLKGQLIASPADTSSSPDDRFGACWGMTREAYGLLGPLNETYRHFFSDRDYYDRAKALGVEVVKWRDIVLSHPESSTYNKLDKEALLTADLERYNKGR
jgi:GT2 family glycosyltransferase